MSDDLKDYISTTFGLENYDLDFDTIINFKLKEDCKMQESKYSCWADYFIPNTDVLKNIPNICDKNELAEYEKNVSAKRMIELYNSPIAGSLDSNHLFQIHGYLFQDVYPWAGQVRTVPMMKQTTFLDPTMINDYLNNFFERANSDFSNVSNKFELAQFLANLFYSLTYAHPFREGNGRTIREFIRQIVNYNDFEFGSFDIDYKKINMENVAYSMVCSTSMFIVSDFQNALVEKGCVKVYKKEV